MGIRFACNNCGHVLHVKQHLAGKRGICPKCQGRIDIPWESTVAKKDKDKGDVETDMATSSATTLPKTPAPAPSAPQPAPAPAMPSQPAPAPVAEVPSPAAPVEPVPTPSTIPTTPAAPVQPGTETFAAATPAATTPQAATPQAAPTTSPDTPPAPAAPALPDPIAENPLLQWYVAPPGSTTPYGPAPGDMFRGWIAEGRVSADSMIWRQDWSEWRRAGDVLPQLMTAAFAAPTAPSVPNYAPSPSTQTPTLMTPGAPTPATAAMIAQRRPKKGPLIAMIVLGVLTIGLVAAIVYLNVLR